jgi:hypothetical protein
MVDPARPSTFMHPRRPRSKICHSWRNGFRANSIPALLCFSASRSLSGASLKHLTTCRRRTRRVRWPVPRPKRSAAGTRSDEAANRQSAGPQSGKSAPLTLARNERGQSEQASPSFRLGKGATRQEAPRVVSVRKRRTGWHTSLPAVEGSHLAISICLKGFDPNRRGCPFLLSQNVRPIRIEQCPFFNVPAVGRSRWDQGLTARSSSSSLVFQTAPRRRALEAFPRGPAFCLCHMVSPTSPLGPVR